MNQHTKWHWHIGWPSGGDVTPENWPKKGGQSNIADSSKKQLIV